MKPRRSTIKPLSKKVSGHGNETIRMLEEIKEKTENTNIETMCHHFLLENEYSRLSIEDLIAKLHNNAEYDTNSDYFKQFIEQCKLFSQRKSRISTYLLYFCLFFFLRNCAITATYKHKTTKKKNCTKRYDLWILQ